MPKNIVFAILTIALLNSSKVAAQCSQNWLNYFDTICNSDSFGLSHSSPLSSGSFSIDFNSSENLQTSSIYTYPGQDTLSEQYSFGIELIQDENGNWFGFTKANNLKLTRLEFGNDLNNLPTVQELTINSSYSVNNTSISGLKIIKKNGQWLGISSFTASRLVVLNFGDSLTNDTINATVHFVGGTASSGIRDLDAFIQNDSIYAVTAGSEGRVSFFNLGHTGSTIYSDTSYLLSSAIDISNARCIKFVETCGSFHVFISGITRRKLIHYSFGGSIHNSPTMSIDAINLTSPYSMQESFEGGKLQLWIKSQTSLLTQINYNDSINSVESTSTFQDANINLAGFCMDLEKINDTINIFTATSQPVQLRRIQLIDTTSNSTGEFNSSGYVSHFYESSGLKHVVIKTLDSNYITSYTPLNINVLPNPIVDFLGEFTCIGDSLHFMDNSSSQQTYSLNWSFGDGGVSSEYDPVHLYSDTGTYSVNLIATTSQGCIDTTAKLVEVYSLPIPSFDYSNLCLGQPTDLIETSQYQPGTYSDSTYWIFNSLDSAFGTVALYTFPDTGSQVIQLRSISNTGCSSHVTDTISINPSPIAAFSTARTCFGDTVEFSNNTFSYYSFTNYWNFGDGTTSTALNPNHSYQDTGYYYVSLKAEGLGSCSDSLFDTIRISEKPSLSLSLPISTICTNESNEFDNITYLNNESIAQSTWLFNNDTAYGLSVNYSSSEFDSNLLVDYSILLGSNCFIDTSFELPIIPNFDLDLSISGFCEDTDNTFRPVIVSNNNQEGDSYIWHIDNQLISSDSIITQNYIDSGNHHVSLTILSDSGCLRSTSQNFRIVSEPVLNFSLLAPFCEGQEIENNLHVLINDIDTVSQFEWIIETNAEIDTIDEFDPIIIANEQNDAIISAVLQTYRGCTVYKDTHINVNYSPDPQLFWDTTCVGEIFKISDLYDGSNFQWIWTVDSNVSYLTNDPEIIFSSAGTHHIDYSIEDQTTTCKADTALNVVISELTIDSLSLSTICPDQSTKITVTTSALFDNVLSTRWEINGEIQNGDSAFIRSTDELTVKASVESRYGCSADIIEEINFFPLPDRSISTAFVDSNSNKIVLGIDDFDDIVSIQWEFQDSIISTQNFDTITFSTFGYGPLNVFTTNKDGCVSSQSEILFVGSPELDITIANLNFQEIDGYRHFNCIIINQTTLDVSTLKLKVTSNEGLIWEEEILSEFNPLESKMISLNTELFNDNSAFYCATITEVNNLEQESNVTCTESKDMQIILFPNPAKDYLTVWASNEKSTTIRARILSINGNVMSKEEYLHLIPNNQNEMLLNLENLEKGLYILEIIDESDNKQYVRKLIKL